MLYAACCGRISYIIFSGNYMASSGYNSYKLVIDKLNETVYDCNMKKLNNNKTKLVAVIKPNEKCLSELDLLFNPSEIKDIVSELSKGYPVIRDINKYVSCKHIKIFEVNCDEKQNTALTAVIKKYNETVGEKSINFAVDAKGRLLDGDNEDVVNVNYKSRKGVVMTVDSKIQAITDEEINRISYGSIVVSDIESGAVLAMSSAGSDGINRCNSNYAVGSIFKLIVAACALENGIEQSYYCNGKIKVGDTEYSCQNNAQHKDQNMQQALQNSCNCYFINLALILGSERLLNTAESFGFKSLPSIDDLKSKGELALFGFGQGKLLATPLEFASAISTIANGGIFNEQSILKGYTDDSGTFTAANQVSSNRIISESTAKTMQKYMRSVVENGTGKNADYKGKSAGKTSTAQSGIYENGEEKLITWFAGFYPYSEPKYAIIVTVEGGKSGAGDCCPIFRTIVENLEKL